MRCDADGGACTYIQKVASTDPETGPTYVVRADDVGYTLRLRVEADVNNDLTPDGWTTICRTRSRSTRRRPR